MSGGHTAGGERTAWFLRPITLFATAYIIITTTHESAHALTAFVLDVPFTLYHFGVDVARDRATPMEQAEIGVAGPLCALIIGLISWLSYKRAGGSRSELMLLYLATFGTGTFFGNLMSAGLRRGFQSRGADPAAPTIRPLRRDSRGLPVSLRSALYGGTGITEAFACWLKQVARNDHNGRPPGGGGNPYRDVGFPAYAFRFACRAAGGTLVLGLRNGGCTNESENSFRRRPNSSPGLG